VSVADQAAALGYPVFPVHTDKKPACPHGFKDATAATDDVRRLWSAYPGELIGVPTGETSGFDVLDVDSAKHHEAKEWWNKHRKYIPHTRVHESGSGGLHLLFQHSSQARTGNGRLGIGIDVKANGGYVVWWPTHRRVLMGAPIAPWPAWLLARQQPQIVKRHFSGPAPSSVEGIVRFVGSIPEGQRNRAAFWGLCRAVEAENQGINGALAAIAGAALKNGLDRKEVASIVRSAQRTVNGA
jgi:hypothetical protein